MSLALVEQFGVVGVQGIPVEGKRRFGVPTGGAFDIESLSLANALAGNDAGLPAWELSMAHATFRADSAGVVGVTGATAAIHFPGGDFSSGGSFAIAAGNTFTVEAPTDGARVYVAFGSVARPSDWRVRLDEPMDSVVNRKSLRVVRGPQADSFGNWVLEWPFTVTQTGNRVGVRLEPSVGPHTIELPSEPQCVGVIQVSNDGTPIILGPDGPTIGGYPKLAVVATCDISRLGQLRPGDKVRFELWSIEQARQGLVESQQRLNHRQRLVKLSASL